MSCACQVVIEAKNLDQWLRRTCNQLSIIYWQEDIFYFFFSTVFFVSPVLSKFLSTVPTDLHIIFTNVQTLNKTWCKIKLTHNPSQKDVNYHIFRQHITHILTSPFEEVQPNLASRMYLQGIQNTLPRALSSHLRHPSSDPIAMGCFTTHGNQYTV